MDTGLGKRAFQSLLRAAELGDEEAQVRVGYEYAYGLIVRVNAGEALRWWKCAYRQGSSSAAFNLGMHFRDGREWGRAVNWFQRAVDLGDADGLVEIAKLHLRYGGVREAGLGYLRQARDAKTRLTEPARLDMDKIAKEEKSKTRGDLLHVEADLLDERGRYAEALPLLLKGAKSGVEGCQILLGNYLSDGRKGVPKNLTEAMRWYTKAYQSGSSTAANNIAMTYRKAGNVDEAYLWYERAVELGDSEAHLALAKIWLRERRNPAKAIKHLRAFFNGADYVSEMGRDEARELLRRLS